MPRLFFALWPEDDVRREIITGARQLVPPGRHATPPGNVHLTLAFLGRQPDALLPALERIGDALRWQPFALELGVTGLFPKAKVAWLAPDSAPEPLLELKGQLDTALAGACMPIETKPFRPHVTLWRKAVDEPGAWPLAPVSWPVNCVALCASLAGPNGVIYRPVVRWMPAKVEP